MTILAGPGGVLSGQFEDGLRFLAAALALRGDQRSAAAAISAGCSSIQCFLKILEAAGERHFPDPLGNVQRLRDQCGALLTLQQDPADAMDHVLEAARLSRDEAARLLVLMAASHD